MDIFSILGLLGHLNTLTTSRSDSSRSTYSRNTNSSYTGSGGGVGMFFFIFGLIILIGGIAAIICFRSMKQIDK